MPKRQSLSPVHATASQSRQSQRGNSRGHGSQTFFFSFFFLLDGARRPVWSFGVCDANARPGVEITANSLAAW